MGAAWIQLGPAVGLKSGTAAPLAIGTSAAHTTIPFVGFPFAGATTDWAAAAVLKSKITSGATPRSPFTLAGLFRLAGFRNRSVTLDAPAVSRTISSRNGLLTVDRTFTDPSPSGLVATPVALYGMAVGFWSSTQNRIWASLPFCPA